MFALTQTTINNGTETFQTVDARQLHAALENGSHFRDWINRRIEEYGFEAGVDYVLVSLKFERNPEGGRPPKEYAITFDMAKELCMLERSPEVAPVQMPEPVAWMLGCQTMGGDVGWKLSWSKSGAGVCHRLNGEEFEQPLYTEHQVRQLLAAHGVK